MRQNIIRIWMFVVLRIQWSAIICQWRQAIFSVFDARHESNELRLRLTYVRTALLVSIAMTTSSFAAEPLVDGFVVEEYATGLGAPTSLAFAPDGRLFVGDRNGTIRIVERGAIRPRPFAEIAVHDFFESGLLSIVVSPNFDQDRFVYAFATVSSEEQNIIRFRANGSTGEDRTIIRDNLPSNGAFHNGGGMAFGPDGKLYFSIGDNGDSENAQSLNTLAGKISRINPDGSTPDDNPFTTPTGGPRAVFAYGFRNTFRFCFAEDGRLFSTDVGSDGFSRREEINLVTRGGNYGWPIVEGFSTDNTSADAFTDPLFAYSEEGSSPTAIVSYSGQHFPDDYRGDLFFVEYARNRIFRLELEGDNVVSEEAFVRADGGPVDMVQGPDGALYYCELIGGRVMRIRFGDDTSELIPIGGADFTDEVDGDEDDDEMTTPNTEDCAAGLPFFLVMMSIAPMAIAKRRRRANK